MFHSLSQRTISSNINVLTNIFSNNLKNHIFDTIWKSNGKTSRANQNFKREIYPPASHLYRSYLLKFDLSRPRRANRHFTAARERCINWQHSNYRIIYSKQLGNLRCNFIRPYRSGCCQLFSPRILILVT